MIKTYSQLFKENQDSGHLLYYAFDWDDNILHMPTKIHMYKREGNNWIEKQVSTAEFAEYRNDSENWKADKNTAFQDFRDNGPRGNPAFVEDMISAISSREFAPAWEDFIECLKNASLFAIITARGHESETMRKGVEWIIDNILSDDDLYLMYNQLRKFEYLFKSDANSDVILRGTPSQNPLVMEYLDHCHFIGVSAPSRGGTPENPEAAKSEALVNFMRNVNDFAESLGKKAKIGFSDDDLKNVKHIEDLMNNIKHEEFANIEEGVVKGTKKGAFSKSVFKFNKEQPSNSLTETSHQTPGLESSVLKFTQFGNMAGHLNPQGPDQRQDDGANAFKRATNYLVKNSNDILGKPKKRKKKKSSK